MTPNCIYSIAIIATMLNCHSSPAINEDQVACVRKFYITVISLKNNGIPNKANIQRLSPLISAAFKNRLLKALAAEEKHTRQMKESEPPLVEGSLFFSLFEGAERLGKVQLEKRDAMISYLAELEYGDPKDKKQHTKWQDRAVIIHENGRWVVEDIELLGDWQFGFKGKLSEMLDDTAKY